jgi:hypothetical protein
LPEAFVHSNGHAQSMLDKDERSHGHSKWARARDAMRASKQALDPQITLTPET